MEHRISFAHRVFEREKQRRTPLHSYDSFHLRSLVAKWRRAGGKGDKAIIMSPSERTLAATNTILVQRAPTPLRKEIRLAGMALQHRREDLYLRLEELGLDPSGYATWTVAELDQRVEALEDEVRRSSLEAIVLEMGRNVSEFACLSTDELEAWIEEQIRTGPLRFTYCGIKTTFVSPEPKEALPVIVATTPAKKEVTKRRAKIPSPPPLLGVTTRSAIKRRQDATQQQQGKVVVPVTPAKNGNFTTDRIGTLAQNLNESRTRDELRSEVKRRGGKIKSNMKAELANILAKLMLDNEADATSPCVQHWSTFGHPLLGKPVVFASNGNQKHRRLGRVAAWMPETDMFDALFRVESENGLQMEMGMDDVVAAIDRATAPEA